MDYELRIVVEKVAISSQEVIKWDTITSYTLRCPTSIGALGLRHAEQIALLEKVQNIIFNWLQVFSVPEAQRPSHGTRDAFDGAMLLFQRSWRYVIWRMGHAVSCSALSFLMAAALSALPSIVIFSGIPIA